MYTRLLTIENNKSFFLLGARGTGKSTWVRHHLRGATLIDLLDPPIFNRLSAAPERLADYVPKRRGAWVIIDEIQRVPELLNVVHQMIEGHHVLFALTGSSARKLRRAGTNLLAGRALTYFMFPLTARELGSDFNLAEAVAHGLLPSIMSEPNPDKYLASYVQTYLREEVQQEGLTRNIAAFSRFLEAASFSQGSTLNVSEVARECEVERKVVEGYFSILEDLLIGARLPVFRKRAKRKMVAHSKFYFFDAGVYRTIRPIGSLDDGDVVPGAAVETLVFQELRALIHYLDLGYQLFYWRTTAGLEVDFILYGRRGLLAIEVKKSRKVERRDLLPLLEFRKDYPVARCLLLYGGKDILEIDGVSVMPLSSLPALSVASNGEPFL